MVRLSLRRGGLCKPGKADTRGEMGFRSGAEHLTLRGRCPTVISVRRLQRHCHARRSALTAPFAFTGLDRIRRTYWEDVLLLCSSVSHAYIACNINGWGIASPVSTSFLHVLCGPLQSALPLRGKVPSLLACSSRPEVLEHEFCICSLQYTAICTFAFHESARICCILCTSTATVVFLRKATGTHKEKGK